jgi:asparagine synthase (glutamine-hydrolysing)
MSGIVGILNRNRRPVDVPLLRALTDLLSFRGPDAQGVWTKGDVGFGHTMLRTTYEAEHETQPAALDGRFFITADVRLDQRRDLIAALEQAGIDVPRGACDPDLILRSYAAWGEDCVDRLRGDFSFAIWDAVERNLFCARDHFGIKPFYYVDLENAFLFSNTLDCLRAHPDVSDQLNDDAIADFLLFGLNCDVTTTTFRDIRRLPGAHALTVSSRGVHIRRYWTPPIDGRIRYKRDEEYVENFLEVFRQAVGDRLRTGRAGMWMSGGLDSPAVAATAKEVAAASGRSLDLRAYSFVYDYLIPDDERYYAGQVADFLKIPIDFVPGDNPAFFDRCGEPDIRTPEPVGVTSVASGIDFSKRVEANSRVVLSGEGADNLMYFQIVPYARDLARRGEWGRLLLDLGHYLWVRPLPWQGVQSRLRGLLARPHGPGIPIWLRSSVANRATARDGQGPNAPRLSTSHPVFPRGHASLLLPGWAHLFECEDSSCMRALIETRFPFLDLRVVEFLLAIPAFPWAFQKKLLRKAMAGRLPPEVLRRRKTPLAANPVALAFQNKKALVASEIVWDEGTLRYVDGPAALEAAEKRRSETENETLMRAFALNFWLRSDRIVRYNLALEASHA